jgi:hypothetical protein
LPLNTSKFDMAFAFYSRYQNAMMSGLHKYVYVEIILKEVSYEGVSWTDKVVRTFKQGTCERGRFNGETSVAENLDIFTNFQCP